MTHNIETQWMGKMQFNTLVNGHTVIMDAPERVGGENHGTIPKPLVLTALSGCTGMDVASLLRKNNSLPDTFSVNVEGEISKRVPIEYVAAHISYEFTGNPEYLAAAIDAVTVSQEKICGVSSMLKKIMPITWNITYNGELVFNNKSETINKTTENINV